MSLDRETVLRLTIALIGRDSSYVDNLHSAVSKAVELSRLIDAAITDSQAQPEQEEKVSHNWIDIEKFVRNLPSELSKLGKIREMRARFGMGLWEAKQAIEKILGQ